MTTLTDLMDHCEAVVRANWQYVFGAKGTILSRDDIKALQRRYGKGNVWDSDLNKAGQICCDCSGLISNMTRIERNSNGYFSSATEKLPISQRKPYMRGWGVWRKNHIGIYDGNDGYYAMDGSRANAVHRNLRDNSHPHKFLRLHILYRHIDLQIFIKPIWIANFPIEIIRVVLLRTIFNGHIDISCASDV